MAGLDRLFRLEVSGFLEPLAVGSRMNERVARWIAWLCRQRPMRATISVFSGSMKKDALAGVMAHRQDCFAPSQ